MQACLPVNAGGLGVRLASHIAPSAFLASASATKELQSLLLNGAFMDTSNFIDTALSAWSTLSSAPPPSEPASFKQLEWDKAVVKFQRDLLLASQVDETSKARLLAVSAPHSGDWLHALPISNCGLRLDYKAI